MVRIGIIGYGIRGKTFADIIQHNAYAELIAVSELNEKTRNLAKKLKVAMYADYREMIKTEKLDAVIVAMPDHLHRDPAIYGAKAGLHLAIEKPLATSTRDAEAIVKAVEKANVKCMVLFGNRWNAPFVEAKEIIDRGELGTVTNLDCCLNDTIWVPTKMLSWTKYTTPGWFLLPHCVEMGLWLTKKKVASVYAVGQKMVLKKKGIDTYDWLIATLKFTDDTAGTFRSCWIYPESMPLLYDFRYELVGTKGAIAIDLRDQMIHKMTEKYSHPGIVARPIHQKPFGSGREMVDSFIDNIRLGTEPLVKLEEAEYVTQILEAVHRSAKEEKEIKL
ncbi:MAG: Gfo/Idh/MocA family oxidoreductase, partial [bacterium]|nr:Gfo/Idh/MocA family oxidoreductase [bacterium]